jgi:GTPase
MNAEKPQEEKYKAGYAALVGKPNVGKSTILNALLGQKISITTPKPQTTRHRVLGILNRELLQVIFLDTPGFIDPRYKLQKYMVQRVHQAVADADIIIMIADVTGVSIPETLIREIKKENTSSFLVLNKCDLINRNEVLPIMESYTEKKIFDEIIPISALKGEGLDELEKTIRQYLPYHPPYYPTDIVSEHPEKFFVAELIREQVFLRYSEEIPYSTTVQILEFKEQEGRKDVIRAEIIVDRESQKPILIGKGGKKLKELGTAARRQIELFLDRPVFLELFVKSRDKWRDDEQWLKRFGYHD